MNKYKATWAAMGAALLLAACGGGGGAGTPQGTQDTSSTRGALLQNPPPRIVSLSAAELTASLQAGGATGQGLLAVAGAPTCGVDVQYIQYSTVGGAGEKTTSSGALMVPNGSAAQCTGARPIVLYAHGTTVTRSYNLADLTDNTNPGYNEAIMIATFYAAQGYIVVAPNYAGYDSSDLSYHPYLNADQQSKDMIDALTAAKKALPTVFQPGTSASAKLFITGYSQGGHVAMATHRAMQALGMPVTAAAPMSGPYALAAQGDATYYGSVNAGGTIFTPMISTSFQKAYGNLYTTPADLYESAYATGIESIIPSTFTFSTLVTSGKLPQLALFSSTPPTAPAGSPPVLQATLNAITPPTGTGATDALFAAGFGTNNLIKNSARLSYLLDAMANPDGAVPTATTGLPATAPASPLRKASKLNDLRGWSPTAPVLMCAGNGDPTVFYALNTGLMKTLWTAQVNAGLVTVVDVDSLAASPGPAADPFYAAKAGFAQAKAQTAAAAGSNPVAQATAVTSAYHGGLVPPFCNAVARGFFAKF
jgi:predicted esterase